MNRANKAVLLSTLVFPGCGLFLLRRPLPATLLTLVAGWALYALTTTALVIAESLSAQILRGEIPLQLSALLTAVHRASASVSQQADVATLVLLGSWVVGIWLTHRAGAQAPD